MTLFPSIINFFNRDGKAQRNLRPSLSVPRVANRINLRTAGKASILGGIRLLLHGKLSSFIAQTYRLGDIGTQHDGMMLAYPNAVERRRLFCRGSVDQVGISASRILSSPHPWRRPGAGSRNKVKRAPKRPLNRQSNQRKREIATLLAGTLGSDELRIGL
jgi:hypothetical protein